jgi:chorismate mutase
MTSIISEPLTAQAASPAPTTLGESTIEPDRPTEDSSAAVASGEEAPADVSAGPASAPGDVPVGAAAVASPSGEVSVGAAPVASPPGSVSGASESKVSSPDGGADVDESLEVPVPDDQAGIEEMRLEIDRLDAEIVRLIQRRTALSHAIGAARRQLGGPRIVYSREMAVLERFRVLGPSGTDLGMLLLAMGRGRLGRK